MNEWKKEMKNLKISEEIYGEWDFGFEEKKNEKEKEKESKDLGIRMVWDPILLDVRCRKWKWRQPASQTGLFLYSLIVVVSVFYFLFFLYHVFFYFNFSVDFFGGINIYTILI